MVGVGLQRVAHAKIIDDETEDDIERRVCPQTRSERSSVVTLGCHELDELIVGHSSGLR